MQDSESFDILFRHLFAQGKQETEVDAARERDGSYVSGYRNATTTSTLERGGLTIVATQLKWMTMSPASDQDGIRYTFEVKQGDKTLFKATREGASKSKNFGAEEMYLGDENTPAKEWLVAEGELPAEFEPAPVA